MKKIILVPLAFVALIGVGNAQTPISMDGRPERLSAPKLGLNQMDKNAMLAASASNKFEIISSQLALQKSRDQYVLKHAKMMISDHTPAQEELKLIAQKKSFALPQVLPTKQQMMINKLSRLSGKAFDRYYTDTQIAGHKETAMKLKMEINKGRDEDVKGYAVKALPGVLMHLDHAKMHAGHMKS